MRFLNIFLRSTLFNIYFFWITAFVSIFGVFIIYFISERKVYNIVKIWARFVEKGLFYICKINFEIRGRENISLSKAAIYASKHQSAFETIIYFNVIDDPKYILKESLTQIPFYGRFLKVMRMISINRNDWAGAVKNLKKQAKILLSEGKNLVIFPEGTRVKYGTKIPYKRGIYIVYETCNAPIIPIAHNVGKFWPKNSWMKLPGTAIIEFLPPIEPGLERDELMKKLENVIEDSCDKLELAK